MIRLARPHPIFPGTVLGLALVTFFEKPIAERRPAPPETRAEVQLLVTSSKDSGPGSLREAIFAADRAAGRARIELRSGRIVLETPLPPFVNPAGIVVEAPDPGVEIDGRGVPVGALLDVDSPRSVLAGLTLRGASGQGVMVRSKGVSLRGLTLVDCEEGVHVLEGAGVSVDASSFDQNGTGIRVDPGASTVEVHDSRFRKHTTAGIWAVSPPSPLRSSAPAVIVHKSRFEDDRMSLVLIHVPAQVEDNHFFRPAEAAAYLTGAAVLRNNRVEGGASIGLYGDGLDGGLLEDNEVSHCLAVGILLRQSRNTEVRRNRLFGNGYGIAVVFDGEDPSAVVAENLVLSQREDGIFVVGASPVLQGNRILRSRKAGLRVMEYVPLRGRRVAGLPVLRDNVLQDNGSNDEVRGEYREPPEAEPAR